MAGQSDPCLSLLSAAEVEFIAEDELVDVVPNMKMDALHMFCGVFGPFYPQIATKVPLWLAVALKKRGKCRIQPPDWMNIEKLTHVLDAERESPREFQPLPFHYVRSALEDIRNVRFHKVENGLATISDRTHAVKLKNLSAMEVNIIRPFIIRALQAFYKHDSPEMIHQPTSQDNRPRVADNAPRRTLRPR
ncbi:DNA replication complex GINS protein [Nymphaea thermarum]|nr:DNA replication complex GINS protein [Nymphaea thermarum]